MGTQKQNEDYCKKEGAWQEFGEKTQEDQGKRNDIDSFKDDVKNGMTWKDVLEEHSGVVARYESFARRYMVTYRPEPRIEAFPLRPWQQALNAILNQEPDPREVIFVVDHQGNAGKSWFARYYRQLHPQEVLITHPGTKVNMINHFIDAMTDYKVVFVDISRSRQDGEGKLIVPYEFCEELKDGMALNMKYQSVQMYFKVPHVVVLMNQDPKMDALSRDRYKIMDISDFPATAPSAAAEVDSNEDPVQSGLVAYADLSDLSGSNGIRNDRAPATQETDGDQLVNDLAQ